MPDFSMQKYWEATDVPPTALNVLRTQAPVLVQYYSPFCPNSQQSSKVNTSDDSQVMSHKLRPLHDLQMNLRRFFNTGQKLRMDEEENCVKQMISKLFQSTACQHLIAPQS